MRRNITLSLPRLLLSRAKLAAVRQDKSLSAFIREALEEKIEELEGGFEEEEEEGGKGGKKKDKKKGRTYVFNERLGTVVAKRERKPGRVRVGRMGCFQIMNIRFHYLSGASAFKETRPRFKIQLLW